MNRWDYQSAAAVSPQTHVPMHLYLRHRKQAMGDGFAFGFVAGVVLTLGTALVIYFRTK